MINIGLAENWYNKGKNANNDVFDKFVCYWIAFDVLYMDESKEEKAQIEGFLNDNYDPQYDAILDATSFFREKTVFRGSNRYPKDTSVYKETLNGCGSNKEKVEKLMLCIYLVRNNLFHGYKDPRNMNDETIIKEASKVLEKYLEVYFRVNP